MTESTPMPPIALSGGPGASGPTDADPTDAERAGQAPHLPRP